VSLDTKYRPLHYKDVLGQDATVTVCKQYVKEGKAFHQSYVFAGAHGSGKTTLARILARAMLCEQPTEGESCGECQPCKAMLVDRSENFIEVDAATNSGKEHVRRITEEAQFGSFSGRRRIYLFDECHELSRQAMDAMLKPLEDNIQGSEEKQLVCLFCTTEPEKMRPAIMSRCAPAFRVRLNTPEEIGKRLSYICDKEGIEYVPDMLPLIAEVCECHVRDAIKAVEGVSMLGKVDQDNVTRYLHMDANVLYLDLLENLGVDLPKVLETVERLNTRVSPATCYERMADVSMLAYRVANLGVTRIPSYWDRDRLKRAGDLHKEFLVEFAQRFAQRPAYASASMFLCDVSALHQRRAGIVITAAQTRHVQAPSVAPSPRLEPVSSESAPSTSIAKSEVKEPETVSISPIESESPTEAIEPSPKQVSTENTPSTAKVPAEAGSIPSEPFINPVGVLINPQAQQVSRGDKPRQGSENVFEAIPVSEFARTLHRRVVELMEENSSSGSRPARRDDVGSS